MGVQRMRTETAGYRDVQLSVRVVGRVAEERKTQNHICEVQLHLRAIYDLKMSGDGQIYLDSQDGDLRATCFVKLYLFERAFAPALNHYLLGRSFMLQVLQPKCGGLDLLAPIPISVSPFDRHHIRSVDSVYRFYKDSIANFSPNLNAQTVLLYTYKLFFNVKLQHVL